RPEVNYAAQATGTLAHGRSREDRPAGLAELAGILGVTKRTACGTRTGRGPQNGCDTRGYSRFNAGGREGSVCIAVVKVSVGSGPSRRHVVSAPRLIVPARARRPVARPAGLNAPTRIGPPASPSSRPTSPAPMVWPMRPAGAAAARFANAIGVL